MPPYAGQFRICFQFVGAFSKLRKGIIGFVLSVSVRLPIRREQLGCHWTGFDEI
jgi:hypothetical protein